MNQDYEKLKKAAENIGVFIEEGDLHSLVSDYISDSIMFVGFMVELENLFDVNIPDEYLLEEDLTFDAILSIVKDMRE